MSKREKIIVVFLSTIGIVGCIIPVLLKPGQYPSDDAFFYLQIASNIVSGHGSTFSRITPTNGYHPLWQLVVSGIYFVVGNDKAAGLWVTCFVQQLLFLGIIYWLYRLNEFLHFRYWYLAIPILSVFYLCIGTYASEAHLHGFIFLIACYYFFRTMLGPLRKTSDWFLVSILFSILFLARLDSIFTIGVFFILAFYVIKTKQSTRKIQGVLALTLPFACFVALYCGYNYFTYGHFFPISGAIKGSFPHFAGYFRSLYPMGYVGGVGTLAALIGALRTKQTGRKIIFFSIGSGSTILMIYVFCFTHHVTGWAWYYVSGVFLLALMCANAFEVVVKHLSEWTKFGLSILIIVSSFSFAVLRSWSEYFNSAAQGFSPFQLSGVTDKKWQIDIANWMKEHLPAHSNIYMYDWPGFVAYYSDMNILPVDGLANDYEYNDMLRKERIANYLAEKKIEYWLGPTVPYPQKIVGYENSILKDSSQIITIYSPLYRVYCGEFKVSTRTKVTNFDGVTNDPEFANIALWKIER